MAITVLKMDGTTETIEPSPGSCKDAIIDKGIYMGPPDSFQVLCEEQAVDDQPLAHFDGKKLVLSPRKEKGGF